MRNRWLVILLMVLMVVTNTTQISYANVPARPLWGNPANIHFDPQSQEFVNDNPSFEAWRHMWGSPGYVRELKKPERVPAKKQLRFVFRCDKLFGRKQTFGFAMAVIATDTKQRKKLRPIFVHRSPHTEETRWDTLFAVNGSIAVLTVISRQLGYPGIAIDEAYPGTAYLYQKVRQEIEEALSQDATPVVFCTILNYNAKASLEFLQELKSEYGARIRTGVGGQLIRVAPQAYLAKPYIDHVAVGDAEVTLEPLLVGNERFAEGYFLGHENAVASKRERNAFVRLDSLTDGSDAPHYTPTGYGDYAMIRERLDEMAHHRLGPLAPVRQLVMESVRGCVWAYLHGTCEFCSLESIDQRPIYRSFREIIELEKTYANHFGATGIFDVSNQWLPVLGSEAPRWLERYAKQRVKLQAPEMRRYVYLVSSSITRETAPLLQEVGVESAYVGIDGWDTEMRRVHGKAQSVDRMLDAAQAANLYIRTAVVIGDGVNRSNLARLPRFVQDLGKSYGGEDGIILSFAPYMEIILPGSPIWKRFERIARSTSMSRAVALYDQFYSDGWQTPDDEESLTREYIAMDQATRVTNSRERLSYHEIRAVQAEALAIAERYFPVAYTRVKGEEVATLQGWKL